MKSKQKITTLLALVTLLVSGLSFKMNTIKADGFTISGEVIGLDKGWVMLIETNIVDRGNAKVIDSVLMQNGKFNFKGKVSHVDKVTLNIGPKYNCDFILENSTIKLELDITKANERDGRFEPKVTGSKYNALLQLQKAKADSVRNREKFSPLVELRAEMEKAYKSKDEELISNYRKKADGFRKLMDEQQEEYRQFLFQYVKKNPGSPISPYVLGFQYSEGRMNKEELETYYKVFKGEAKETAMFKYYKKTYTEIFETLGIGSKAPDFELKTVDGKMLKLSGVKGKYMLVDYWASWCVPCRASFPHLKELYAKYKKDGFDVVAIGTADEEPKWRKAIEEDKTVWNHLYDVSADHNYGKVAKMYGVPFLPTTFLMDENRVIVGRNLNRGELDAKLKELFGY